MAPPPSKSAANQVGRTLHTLVPAGSGPLCMVSDRAAGYLAVPLLPTAGWGDRSPEAPHEGEDPKVVRN